MSICPEKLNSMKAKTRNIDPDTSKLYNNCKQGLNTCLPPTNFDDNESIQTNVLNRNHVFLDMSCMISVQTTFIINGRRSKHKCVSSSFDCQITCYCRSSCIGQTTGEKKDEKHSRFYRKSRPGHPHPKTISYSTKTSLRMIYFTYSAVPLPGRICRNRKGSKKKVLYGQNCLILLCITLIYIIVYCICWCYHFPVRSQVLEE